MFPCNYKYYFYGFIHILGWSEDLVVEAFKADQKQALDKAGISVEDMGE